MKICYDRIFKEYAIRQKGESFSPTTSAYLWFKLYDFCQKDYQACDLDFEALILSITEQKYYVASLAKTLRGKQIIQHGEIYAVNRQDLIDFLTVTHKDFADKWGMFTPVFEFNEPIQSMFYFLGNRYWQEFAE